MSDQSDRLMRHLQDIQTCLNRLAAEVNDMPSSDSIRKVLKAAAADADDLASEASSLEDKATGICDDLNSLLEVLGE